MQYIAEPKDPNFTATTGTDNPLNGFDGGTYSSPTFADVDKDGDFDAFIGEKDGIINYFENDGGTFTEITGAANPLNGFDVGFNSTPTFADVDGDGDLDAFIGEYDGNINYFENDSGTFTEITGAANPLNGVNVGYNSSPTFADVDKDGDFDAFIGEKDGIINYFENDGGTFTEITVAANPFNGFDVGDNSSPTFADVDGDGDLDAFIGETGGNINYFENDGGTFTEITGAANPFNGVNVGSLSTPTFADVDGDGDLDAFIGEFDGNINYFENAPADPIATITPGVIPSEDGPTNGNFVVTLDAAQAADVIITYTVSADSTATSGTDYAALSGTVTIPAGDTTANIDIAPIDDGTPEVSENIKVTLDAGTGYQVGDIGTAVQYIAEPKDPNFIETTYTTDNPLMASMWVY